MPSSREPISASPDDPPRSRRSSESVLEIDSAVDGQLNAVLEADCDNLDNVVGAINQTTYVWDIVRDKIVWQQNATQVLGVSSKTDISNVGAFNRLVSPEHVVRRTDAILSGRSEDRERGVPYRMQYRIRPTDSRDRASIWIEDYGRWWPGDDGRASYARGCLRVVNENYVEEQRQLFSSDIDELTGVLTRERLMEALTATINVAKQQEKCGILLIASVNNLAAINESLGFDVGDEMIAAAGRVIRNKLRRGDTVGRYSSNKFGIILHDNTPDQMGVAAERLIATVRRTSVFTSACQMSVTISMGGVSFPDQVDNANQAVNCAMDGLERARQIRGDSFVRYEPNGVRDTKRQRSIEISDEVLSALEDDRLSLALQPMISAKTGEPALYECLVRLQKAAGGSIAPGEFIPIAEELGLSRLVDQRVLELAVQLLVSHPWLQLSVNISGLTIGDSDWMGALRGLMQQERCLANRLVVEITETALIDDMDQALSFIDTVKELGCRVAIDDFGAGYTSFKNLKCLPVDMVKIDGSFVQNLASDKGDQVFVKAMSELAQTFNLEIVAEWVGDLESAQFLRKCGITYMQGFLYGEPFQASDLEQMRGVYSTRVKASQ